ncbi:MAG: glycosyltransferase family 9 protein [Desulfobacterales bacterium]|nr:glycosyltransferase family 9 protein [Desulfobacterales bacterium]
MKIGLVRAIDRYAGIPACLVMSIGCWLLKKTAAGSLPARPVQRILFIELSEMGSAILAYPAMKYILERHPGAELYFLIFKENRFSVDLLNIMPPHHVYTISIHSALAFIRSTVKALRDLRRLKIDVVFDLELFSRFSALLATLSGAPVRAGYHRYHMEGLYRGSLMTHPVMYTPHQHMSKNFLAMVKSLAHGTERPLAKEIISGPLPLPGHIAGPEEKAAVLQRLIALCPAVKKAKHLILLNPSAGTLLPIRAWPFENYVELSRRILQGFDAVIIIVGLSDAIDPAEKILGETGKERCVSLAGKTSVSELLALFAQSSLLITADGGPAHFATLTRTPSLVFFGPETPALYGPLGDQAVSLFAGLSCSPCLTAYNHRKTTCQDPRCMSAISVDQAFAQVEKILSGFHHSQNP